MSSTDQEISTQEYENLQIQCASVKGKFNSAKCEIKRLKNKFNKTFEFILNTKNEELTYNYLIEMNASIAYYHYAEIYEYTNKHGKTHMAYMDEYKNYYAKVTKTSKPPICAYWDKFEELSEDLDYNEETGRYELNKKTMETPTGKYLTIANTAVKFSV
tara:strand:- start:699 stop:1175 length:477 start_codon:yes stop_codon:yes gene_type:complete